MRRGILVLCVLGMPHALSAQGATDLFRVELREADGRISAGRVTRLTNRAGYDNQPHVLPGGTAVLYTSIDSTGQADIFRMDLATGQSRNITRSAPESEYSATLMPDGDRFSAVRVEADSVQRLWSFDLDGTDPRVVLASVRPVGYHAWVDADRLALFVLGDPATLQIADVRSGNARIVAERIGRSLHRIPGRTAVSFVQREGDAPGWINVYDPTTATIEPLIAAVDENEYHAWLPSGILISARGSTLLQWNADHDEGWVEIADLSAAGVTSISRIATSPDGQFLVLVAAHQ
jgi:tricorn protease-like protein